MNRIDAILENYERELQKATEGRCKKVSRCREFRESFKKQYSEKFAQKLEELTRKLEARGHRAEAKEKSPEKIGQFLEKVFSNTILLDSRQV